MHKKHLFLSGTLFFAYLACAPQLFVDSLPVLTNAKHANPIAEFAATLPRKVYAYSVVRGGVLTPDELEAARRSDPVVAEHFSNFEHHTYITRLPEDMYAYVSYRKGNKVYWTKKKHRVCKGEVVITDGKHYARTRCANQLSKVFKAPNLVFHEPTPVVMDSPPPPSEVAADIPSDPALAYADNFLPRVEPYAPQIAQSGAQTGAQPGPKPYAPDTFPSEVILPQFLPFAGIAPALFGIPAATTPVTPVPPVVPPVVTPVVTPEPGTFVPTFLAAGLAGAALLRRKWKGIRRN